MTQITIRILGSNDRGVLDKVAPDVFDRDVDPRWSAQFFADRRHHIAVAIDESGTVVGMASGVHYVHPDKAPEMFINEVGVAPTHQGMRIGTRVMQALLDRARSIGCVTAWVLTSPTNATARRLYLGVGGVEETEAPIMFQFPLDGEAEEAR
jgi:ribosomal protein S18 acetylase RimI-like enzyme